MTTFDTYEDPIVARSAPPAAPSFDDYVDPTSQKRAPPPAAPAVGYGEDIGKGFVGGVGRGVAGSLGIGGTMGNLTHAALAKLGVSEDTISRAAGVAQVLGRSNLPGTGVFGFATAPDPAQIQKDVEGYTGKFYVPKTVPGQYASTLGEYAPSALIPGGGGVGARVLNTVAPAIASETAGQATKDTAAEPWARAVFGLLGGVGAAKAITPAAAAAPARQGFVETLDAAGIPVTAGQRTGSRPITMLESNAADMPFSAGRAAELQGAQADAFDRAITERIYDRGQLTARGVPEDVNLPDPRVVTAGRQSLSDEYDRIHANPFQSDPQLHQDIQAVRDRYEGMSLPSQRAGGARDLEAIHSDLIDKLVAGQGSMPGDEYQALRSRLGTLGEAARNSDPVLAEGLHGFRAALDDAMARGLSPRDAAALALNNQRWGSMRQIEGAVARGGENLSPLAVAQTARAGRPGQYAAQTGNLDELAKAASIVMKPPPNSGTAARLGWQTMFNLPAMLQSGGGGAIGSLFGPIGAAAGAMAPHAFSRAVLSRPVQAYLGNQALPQNLRDVIAQTVAQQAIAQPSGISRNAQARADYERQREANRIQQGLPPSRLYVSPNRE